MSEAGRACDIEVVVTSVTSVTSLTSCVAGAVATGKRSAGS